MTEVAEQEWSATLMACAQSLRPLTAGQRDAIVGANGTGQTALANRALEDRLRQLAFRGA